MDKTSNNLLNWLLKHRWLSADKAHSLLQGSYSENEIISYLKQEEVSTSQLAAALSLYYNVPTIDLEVKPPAETLLSSNHQLYYWRYRFVPWKKKGNTLTLVTSRYYQDLPASLAPLYPGVKLNFAITEEPDLEHYLLNQTRGKLSYQASEELWQLRPWQSAKQRLTPNQSWTFAAAALAWLAFAVYNAELSFKYTSFAMQLSLLGTVIFNVFLFLTSWCRYRKVESASLPPEINGANYSWPRLSILVALYREASVVDQLITALSKLDYDNTKLEIILVTEADDHETNQALAASSLPPMMQVVPVPVNYPRTKGKALNYALNFVTGEYVGVFDAEDIPGYHQLKRALVCFSSLPKEYVCLQSQLNFYNYNNNWLTRLFALEYSKWFEYILPAMHDHGMPIPLGGSSNYFKTDYLRALGGWDPYNVTEDADLGMRIAMAGFKTYLMRDTNTLEEAPIKVKPWIKQRLRWTKGYLQTYLVHTRRPKLLWRQLGARQTFAFIMIYHMRYLVYLYLIMLAGLAAGHSGLLNWPIVLSTFVVNLPSFALINYRKVDLGIMGRVRVKWWNLLLVPLYNLMYLGAVVASVVSLIKQPHYWHKTKHGRMLYKELQRGTKEG